MFLEVCRKTEFSFLSPGCRFIVPKYKKERKILSGEILQRVKIIAKCFAVYEYDRVLFIEICADKGVKSKECSLFFTRIRIATHIDHGFVRKRRPQRGIVCKFNQFAQCHKCMYPTFGSVYSVAERVRFY